MGGSYTDYRDYRAPRVPTWQENVDVLLQRFFKDGTTDDLLAAYAGYSKNSESGFIRSLLVHKGCKEAPKEFPELEYEVKFAIDLTGKTPKEPTVKQYLDAFVFPTGPSCRFVKDAISTVAQGHNHFFGKDDEERLVVIDKAGGTYIKEKSQPLPLDVNVPFKELVIKRVESRYEADVGEVVGKIANAMKDGGQYHGHIVKNKGDDFVLDTLDGRIYSFTVTTATSVNIKDRVQRQLEIEYAGFVPGFLGFVKDDETQIVSGMVDLAKHVAFFGNNAPIPGVSGARMQVKPTRERKYDFISGATGEQAPAVLPLFLLGVKNE